MAPLLRWEHDGPVGRGAAGVTGAPLDATVGVPRAVSVWTTRDPSAPDDERSINLRWLTHQGAGAVTFGEQSHEVDAEAWAEPGQWTEVMSEVTFSEPGDYLLRVLAFNVVREFEFQCCWTNGFVPVTVAP